MITAVAAITTLAVLGWAGLAHLRQLSGFAAAIAEQRVLPARLIMPLAVSVALFETVVGVGGIALLVASVGPTIQAVLLIGVAVVYAGYGLYGLYLVRARPGVPCACANDSEPVDSVVVGRAAALAALALVAALHAPTLQGLTVREAVIVALASVAYGLAIWSLPAALRDPGSVLARSGA